MRKILLSAVALLAAVSAKAQGTWYAVSADMTDDPATVVSPKGEETAVATDIEGAEFFITDGGENWECKSAYDPEKVFTANNGKDYPKAYIQGGTNGMGALNAGEDGNLIPGDYKTAPGLIKDGSTSAHLKIVPSTKGTVYVAAKYGKNKAIWAAKIANEELEDVDYSDLTAYIYNYEGLFIQTDGNYGGKVAAESDTYAALPLDVEEGYTYLFWVAGSKLMLAAIDFVTGGETSSDTWTVAGVTSLCGSEWNPADTSNDMKSSDGVNFTLVKEGIVLEKDVKVEFKVVKNHAWGEEYPSENYKFSAEETGTYTVTINFNADSKEITIALEKTGEAVIGEKTYSVVRTLTTWDDDVDMTWNEEDKVYTALFENVPAGKYELKVRVNHDWGENYGDNGDNYVLELEKDAESVRINFDPETKAITNEVVYGGDEPAGNTVLWDTETAFDSWSATIVIEAEKFANVKAGDIIRVSYKDKGGDFNPIYKHVDDWSDWTDFQDAINKDNEGYFEAPVTEGAIAELQSKGLRFQGVGFTLTKVELISDASAINSVKAAKKFEGAIFNVAGQKVNASYKGLVIKDGKKYIQK